MFGPPTPQEIALNYTMEYGANSPRLRTTVIAYMLEYGQTPSALGLEEFLTTAEAIAGFVSAKSDEFFAEVNPLAEASQPDPSELDIKGNDTDTDNGYNYL